MTNQNNKCNMNEVTTCCCVDVGTVIDNSDCKTPYQKIFPTQKEADNTLTKLTEKANAIASEPCQITSRIETVTSGIQLSAEFTFSCQAENMIFQLALR